MFDELIRLILNPTLGKLGFEYDRMTFFRELPSGIIDLIGFAFDPRTTKTFRVLCGMNTRMIESEKALHPREMGYSGAQHLTRDGWSCNSGFWPCSDEQSARTSLMEIGDLIPRIVEPWFQAFKTLSSVAALMDTQHPRQGLDKARLFLAGGNRADAKKS